MWLDLHPEAAPDLKEGQRSSEDDSILPKEQVHFPVTDADCTDGAVQTVEESTSPSSSPSQ